MSSSIDIKTVDREPSKEFFNLVEEFAQSFEKPKEVYKKLVDRGREEGFNDGEINMLINSYLKGRIAKSTLYDYRKEFLELPSPTKKSGSGQIDDNKVIEHSSQDKVKDKPEQYQDSQDLKKFRDERGTIEQQHQQPQEQEMIIHPSLLDQKVEEIARLDKEIEELKDLIQNIKKEKVESAMSKSHLTEYSIELSDQDLKDIAKNGGIAPLLLTLHQDGKTQTAKLDRTRLHQKKK